MIMFVHTDKEKPRTKSYNLDNMPEYLSASDASVMYTSLKRMGVQIRVNELTDLVTLEPSGECRLAWSKFLELYQRSRTSKQTAFKEASDVASAAVRRLQTAGATIEDFVATASHNRDVTNRAMKSFEPPDLDLYLAVLARFMVVQVGSCQMSLNNPKVLEKIKKIGSSKIAAALCECTTHVERSQALVTLLKNTP